MEKIRKQFLLSLQRGLGRAFFILKENPAIDFSAEILQAVKICYCPEAQDNGGAQGKYLFELMQMTPQEALLRRQVFDWLENIKDDKYWCSWELYQWYEIAVCYALQGNEEAKQLLYQRISEEIATDNWRHSKHLWKADGLVGLLYLLDLKGKKYHENPEYDDYDWYWIERFQGDNTHLNILDEVMQASQTNPYIKLYLDKYLAYQEKKQQKKAKSTKNWDFEKLVKSIRNLDNKRFFIINDELRSFLKSLTEAEIKQLADDFLKTNYYTAKNNYLKVFEYVKFPYDYQILLDIVKKDTENWKEENLRDSAINALNFFQADDIRAFALEKLKQSTDCEVFIPLLAPNYQEGDSKIIMQCLQKMRSVHRFHSVNYAVEKVYVRNKTRECFKPLAYLYERVNCGICRQDILELMHENGVLSDEIRREIQFDANRRVREFWKSLQTS